MSWSDITQSQMFSSLRVSDFRQQHMFNCLEIQMRMTLMMEKNSARESMYEVSQMAEVIRQILHMSSILVGFRQGARSCWYSGQYIK